MPALVDWWLNLEPVRLVHEFPLQLWLLFLVHCLDSFGMFAISTNLTLYLHRVFGFSDMNANLVYTLWGIALVFCGIPTGFLIDRIGLGRSLTIGSTITAAAKILFAMSTNIWLSLASLFVGTTIGAGLFGSAIDLAVARYSRRKVAKTYIFHFLYTTMNIGAIAALYGVDWALAATDGWSGYRLLFSIGAAGSVVACWITFLYDESKHLPETLIVQEDDESDDVDAGSAVQQFTLRSALAILVEPDFIRLFVFSLVFTGVRSVFRYMETLLSVYLTRVYPEIPYGGVLAINPILIIILTPMMGMVTVHLLRDYWWMVAGSLLSALAPLLVYVWTGSSSIWSVYLFLAFFTLGEAIWSPKVKEWIIEKSPKGKKGIYSGLIPLSTFGGTIISGIVSGQLLTDYCPENESEGWVEASVVAHYAQSCKSMWIWIVVSALTTPVLCSVLFKPLSYIPRKPAKSVDTTDTTTHEFPLLEAFDVDAADDSADKGQLLEAGG